MSRCSSFPFLPADPMIRCSASRIPSDNQPHDNKPIFKDGYLYVTPQDYRRIATIARYYTNIRHTIGKRPKEGSHRTASEVNRRHKEKRRKRDLESFLTSEETMHVHFKNDIHSNYLKSQYHPTTSEKRIEILKLAPNPEVQKHPKFTTLGNTPPKVLPTWYRKYRSSYKTYNSTVKPRDNLRPDKFLEEYRKTVTLEQKGEPFVFTGPQSAYNTLDKINMLLRDSTNPGTNVDRKILDKAINATVQEFKNVKIKPISYNDVISSRQFLRNRRHDTGFSGIGFADKFELANNPSFRSYAKNFANSGELATYKLFWKTENLKKTKAQLIPRIIYGTNLEAEMAERQSFQPFLSSLKHRKWSTPSKIGISNQEFPRLYARHNLDKGWLANAIDFSKQDRYMPKPIMDARKRVMTRIAELQGNDRRTINNIARIIDKTSSYYVVTPTGEVVQLNSGHPSGLYLGAEGNTINHRIIHNYVDIKHGFENMRKVDSQYGDDALRSLPPRDPMTRKYLRSRSTLFQTIEMTLVYRPQWICGAK